MDLCMCYRIWDLVLGICCIALVLCLKVSFFINTFTYLLYILESTVLRMINLMCVEIHFFTAPKITCREIRKATKE